MSFPYSSQLIPGSFISGRGRPSLRVETQMLDAAKIPSLSGMDAPPKSFGIATLIIASVGALVVGSGVGWLIRKPSKK